MFGSRIDWDTMERLYVCGEVTGHRGDGTPVRTFPSIRDLEMRFNVARSAIGRRSKRCGWPRLREKFQRRLRERRYADVANEREVTAQELARAFERHVKLERKVRPEVIDDEALARVRAILGVNPRSVRLTG